MQTRKTVRKLSTLKEEAAAERGDKVAKLERQLMALKAADLDLVHAFRFSDFGFRVQGLYPWHLARTALVHILI